MSNTESLILSIIWIILSLLWFWIKNTVLGVIWLCAGIFGLAIFLVKRRNK